MIFIKKKKFCYHDSNIGGAAINDVALDFWHSGQNREDIGMEDLEHRLRAETMESQGMQQGWSDVHLILISPTFCKKKKYIYCKIIFLFSFRRVCSEWAHVRSPDRLLCAIFAPGVPARQALCTRRLHSKGSRDGWSNAGRGGQGHAVRAQRGETVLSPGVQVHTAEDQLLSALNVQRWRARGTWRRRLICFTGPSVCRATWEMCPLCSVHRPSPHRYRNVSVQVPHRRKRQQGRSRMGRGAGARVLLQMVVMWGVTALFCVKTGGWRRQELWSVHTVLSHYLL